MDDPMQVETHVMVDGQYQTRRANLRDILATQRVKTAQKQEVPKSLHAGPYIGIVSRTLLHSPMINHVFPARIRRGDKNDLVFVGEDFVHVKEASPDGSLHHVAFHATDSHIRAAAILGTPSVDHSVEGEGLSKPKVKDEHGVQKVLPPEILVCTLQSGNLQFIWPENRLGATQFRIVSFALPIDISHLKTFGKHLAVDAHGRAIAVAPSEGGVMFYNLLPRKEMEAMWEASPEEFHPFKNETAIAINGTILNMTFLQPSTNPQEKHVASLVVIFKAVTKVRMMCYEWDVRDANPKIDTVVKGYPMSHEIKNPQMIIPLERSRSFCVVSDNLITHITGIQTRDPVFRGPLPLNSAEPRYPGLSRSSPLCTHWSRAIRHADWKDQKQEAFYVVREDGQVIYIEATETGVSMQATVGIFDCHINKAFAAFMIGDELREPDYLIASGSMSEGQLLKIGGEVPEDFTHPTRETSLDPQSVQTLRDWAPTPDMILTNLQSLSPGQGRPERRPLNYPSIFTTAGNEPYGAIVEQRIGLELRNGTMVDSDLFLGTTKLWTFWDADMAMYILASRAEESNLFRIQDGDLIDEELTSANCGFNPERPTVAAGDFGQYVVQVTPEAAFVCSPTHEGIALPQDHTFFATSGGKFVAADIDQSSMTIAFVSRQDNRSHLHLVEFDEDEAGGMYDRNWGTVPLPSVEVTCIRNMSREDAHVVFLGLSDGTIAVFPASPGAGLSSPFFLPLSGEPASTVETHVAETVTVLENIGSANEDGDEFKLLCGLRNGELCHDTFILRATDAGETEIVFKGQMAFIRIGQSSLFITDSRESSAAKYAYGVCGSVIVTIFCDTLDFVNVERVWIADQHRSAFRQPTVCTLAAIPLCQVQNHKDEVALAYIVGEHLYLGTTSTQVKPVPRRIDISGSPERIMYSPFLKAFIVSSVRTEIRNGRGRSDPDKRIKRGVIYVVKPDGGADEISTLGIKQEEGENSRESLILGAFDLYPSERVHSLCEWELQLQQRRMKDVMILVGTSYTKRRSNRLEELGRIIILRIALAKDGTCKFAVLQKLEVPAPVRAVASYEKDGVVMCTGKNLVLKRYSKERKRLLTTTSIELQAPGYRMSVLPPVIHVSTATDSVMSYRVQNRTNPSNTAANPDRTHPVEEFVLFGSDTIARTSATHLEVTIENDARSLNGVPWLNINGESSPKLLLVSDKDKGLAALWQPPSPDIDRAGVDNRPASEISLNRSITTLRQLSNRPPWRNPSQYLADAQEPRSPSDSPTVRGALVDNLLGSSHDGTLFAFTIVDAASWRLLRFLQNLVTSVTKLTEQRPANGSNKDNEEDEEDGRTLMQLGFLDPDRQLLNTNRQTNFHINGDIVMALLRPGGVDDLVRMLHLIPRKREAPPGERAPGEPESQDSWDQEFGMDLDEALGDYEDNQRNKREVKERVERFRQLAAEFGTGQPAEDKLEEVVERVLKWVRVLLMSPM
ncbi:hypothetical protein P152DRAFT_474717 [Eremomyces bilateralis CBS 781.70]|uniref:Cleavage/polyadenylation specificity factor A subunit N-terminal domain-containing protein n=1 Tax=Eremomyces bilateralis CBS 781.70 TaxID=1392243 RepID=A0A6G1G0V8_9PEZI|nr:uncharacterized protein P152DRAFT_474717 [Eremomyces bilateralis CBS 781.70]KAF1811560.1 hypothetical protein P152DRAFT_474717 [Eremomyces bilateralis CBS 781.70]